MNQKILQMKKLLLSASITMMITAGSFAQDTIPPTQTPTVNILDTIPMNKSQKDSADWNDKTRSNMDTTTLDRTKSSQDSMQSKWQTESSTMNKDSATMSEKQNSDTLTSMGNNADSVTNAPTENSKANAMDSSASNNSQSTMDSAAKTEAVTDRVIMRDGAMFMIRNNESTPLTEEFKLASGTTIGTDGTVKYVSGKTATLKDGQFIEISDSGDGDAKDKKKSKKAARAERKKQNKTTDDES